MKTFKTFKEIFINESFAIDKKWAKKELIDFNRISDPTDLDFQNLVSNILKHLNIKVKDKDKLIEHLEIIYSDKNRFDKNDLTNIINSFINIIN